VAKLPSPTLAESSTEASRWPGRVTGPLFERCSSPSSWSEPLSADKAFAVGERAKGCGIAGEGKAATVVALERPGLGRALRLPEALTCRAGSAGREAVAIQLRAARTVVESAAMSAPVRRLVGDARRGMDRWPGRLVFSTVCIPVGVSLLLGEVAALEDFQTEAHRE